MKFDINQITQEGLILEEEIRPAALDLEIEGVSFSNPLKVTAQIARVSSIAIAKTNIHGSLNLRCSRCLKDVASIMNKDVTLTYPLNSAEPVIYLDDDIRQEVILEYPVKILCKPDCLGLCPKCGKDLNEGRCSCK